jgi:hypothetical protein
MKSPSSRVTSSNSLPRLAILGLLLYQPQSHKPKLRLTLRLCA